MTTPQHPAYPFLHPKYWLTWFVLGLLWLVIKLPYGWQMKIGRLLGRVGCWFMPYRRHITDVNLKLCFPELSTSARTKLLRQSFESAGMGIIETGLAWWAPYSKIKPLFQYEGIQHLEQALSKGLGAIALGAHFTTLDLYGRIMAEHFPISVIYRDSKNPLIDHIMFHGRHNLFKGVLHRRNVRSFISALRKNQALWYAPDQDYGHKHSVFAPFFGISAATITGISRLAKISQSPVIPVFSYRLPHDAGYKVVALPPLENFPSDDPVQDATRVNQVLETAIRQSPEQYLWQHRRFKSRPEGESRPY